MKCLLFHMPYVITTYYRGAPRQNNSSNVQAFYIMLRFIPASQIQHQSMSKSPLQARLQHLQGHPVHQVAK